MCLQGQRANNLHQAVGPERDHVRRRGRSRPRTYSVCSQHGGRRGGNQERRPQGALGHGEDQQDLLHCGERRPAGGHGPAEETKVKNNSKLNI